MGGFIKPLWLAAMVLSCLSSPSLAIPDATAALGDDVTLYSDNSHPLTEIAPATEKRKDRIGLRIMPFGASIMSGVGSSTKDGLRKYLRDALRLDGWEVNMVGSLEGGQMKDDNHEAVPGDEITDAEDRLKNALGFKANIVIINLGTNDAVRNVKVSEAGKRMENVLNKIWKANGMDETCIILSTLIPTNNQVGINSRLDINSQYRGLVEKHSKDKCIYLADMAPNGQEWFDIPDDYVATENPHVHPNDQGHKKMAAIFFQAIKKAASDGKIVKAGDFEASEKDCDKFEGSGVDAGGKTQRGSGYEDGEYEHDSKEMGSLWKHESEWDRNQWRFARLFHRNYDDLVAWIEDDDDVGHVYATWANSADGKGEFSMLDDMNSDLDCEADGVNFIDMNGDGLDDLVCIGGDGDAFLSVNQGDGDRKAKKPPSFKSVGLIKKSETTKRKYVLIADIDGDGRGDYGVMKKGRDTIEDGSSTRYDYYFWRNGWVDDKPKYWQAMGKRDSRKVDEEKTRWGGPSWPRFEDINGDGRDDSLTVNSYGGTVTFTNSRSCRKSVVGDGLNVAWRHGTLRGDQTPSGYFTHAGVQGFIDDDDDAPGIERFHFARIYGEASAFGNLPKKDYVWMKHDKVKKKHHFDMRVWKNTGHGATKIRVDGNKYCNMMGHEDGRMDYVWVFQGGKMEIYVNRGKKKITDDDPDGWWEPSGTIWEPPQGMHRKDLHLADWDGDGVCDIIYVDPDKDNAIEVWINEKPGKWEWKHLFNPAPGVTCSEERGIGIHDLAVRFADLTGNKRADYLCIKPDGHVSAFLHPKGDGSWEDAGQIKFEEGKDRANLRWADVNGDGLDDMIWIEKFSGDTWVWYNGGRGNPDTGGGSSFYWRRQEKKAYAGLAAGTCIFYADLNGDGRADEHYVTESFNNIAYTSLSPSCGLHDVTGDDDKMDGDLPKPPATNPDHCIKGTGPEGLGYLCEFVCKYDYCLSPCKCEKTGGLVTAPSPDAKPGKAQPGQPEGVGRLCAFSCSRRFCPPAACIAAEDSSDTCDSDPQEAQAWEDSGAASLVDNYIKGYGNDDWLRGADVRYHLGSDESGLNCDSISSNHCPAPQGACSSWKEPSFWYVRHMVSRINEHFTFAHEKLQDENLRKLALVDQMIVDFKADVPDPSLLKKILGNAAGAAGLASAMAGVASLIPGPGGLIGSTIFSVVSGAASLANANIEAEPEDLDELAAASKAYVVSIMDDTGSALQNTLPAFFGNGNLTLLTEMYDKLKEAGLIDESHRATTVGKVLDGGGFMVPVLQSEIADAITDGIHDTIVTLVGNLLASLHYMVVRVFWADKDECKKSSACQLIDDYPFYLIRRPKGRKSSEEVPKKSMDALKNTYGIEFKDMLTNVKACNNGELSPGTNTTIYMGPDRYPPCYFGLAYVDAQAYFLPPISDTDGIKNKDDLPEWIPKGSDMWKPKNWRGDI